MFTSVEIRYMLATFAKSAMTVGAAAGCLLMTAGNASAFSFTTNFNGTPPKGNIFLQSVVTDQGTKISDFALVSEANIVYNDPHTGGNTGAASSDKGDDADGIVDEKPDAADVVASLGNLNLNNILDTEDKGKFELTLNFSKGFNTLLLWERGKNSQIGIKAGGVDLGVFSSADFADAGFGIDTTEINGTQKVGSRGFKLSDYGISGSVNEITLYANKGFNGPDFKVVGATVPEPATVIGLTAIAGAFVAGRRRKNDRTA